MTASARRAAVLGHPIGHSLSPVLHGAAYASLGLDWRYDAVDVTEAGLAGFLDGLGEEWVGLSLTMPLKQRVLDLAASVDDTAEATGAANTIVWAGTGQGRRAHGYNTDVTGIVAALTEPDEALPDDREAPSTEVDADGALVLGAGATAASALAALGQLGASAATALVRSVERAAGLREVALRLGVALEVTTLDSWSELAPRAGLVVSTLPGGAGDVLAPVDAGVRGTLLDVAYAQRPTALGSRWHAAGGRYVSGERMLLHQAVEQVRLFAQSTGLVVDDLPSVTAAMDTALQQYL